MQHIRAMHGAPVHANEPPPGAPLRAQGLPVDWWDRDAGVWRPTIAVTVSGRPGILVPAGDAAVAQPVAAAALRLPSLLTDALARHCVTRARLMLLLALVEDGAGAQPALRRVVAAERDALGVARLVWQVAFERGTGTEAGVHPLPLAEGARELLLPELPEAVGGRAASLLAAELLRTHAALVAARCSRREAALHPLVHALAALLGQAVSGADDRACYASAIRPPAGVSSAWLTGSMAPPSLSRNQS